MAVFDPVVNLTKHVSPRNAIEGDKAENVNQANEIQNQINFGPIINAAAIFGGVVGLNGSQEMAIGGNDEGGYEDGEFANES